MNQAPSWTTALRKRAGSLFVDGFFKGAARAGRLTPLGKQSRYDVDVRRDVVYDPAQGLAADIYVPRNPRPDRATVLYLHGGGFRILSKDTHWIFGYLFAQQGYTVVMPNYRLAPANPYPAAIEDACRAYAWTIDHAAEFGANPSQLVVAGESAGGNLALGVTLAACFAHDAPYARSVFETGVVPRAAYIGCGMLQVSNPERFAQELDIPEFINDRILEVAHSYLPDQTTGSRDFADPIALLETDAAPDRPVPPMIAPCGLADPLVDDTRRLEAALVRRGVSVRAPLYPRAIHAFMAFAWNESARASWAETWSFLEESLAATPD